MADRVKIINIHSSVEGKLPAASVLEFGELAVNYHPNTPRLSFKDSEGDIRTISDDEYNQSQFDEIKGIIEVNEKVTAAALVDLDNRVNNAKDTPNWNSAEGEKGYINGRTHFVDKNNLIPLNDTIFRINYADNTETSIESVDVNPGGGGFYAHYILWENANMYTHPALVDPYDWRNYVLNMGDGLQPLGDIGEFTVDFIPYEEPFEYSGFLRIYTYGHDMSYIQEVFSRFYVQTPDMVSPAVYPLQDFYIPDNISRKSYVDNKIANVKTLPLIETTYLELKSLRDNGELVPGMQYRIIDYVTTTTSYRTQSANHQFDIIVTADTEDTLNEIARACLHEGDIYFSENNAKLEAWQIWYCLDNDTKKYAWADTTNGKGVIYRMIDEWNNDVPYDFKNIMFMNQLDTNDINYYYTFNYSNPDGYEDMTVKINSYYNVSWEWRQQVVYNNIIRPCFSSSTPDTYKQSLNYIIFDRKNIYDSETDDYYSEGRFDEIENFYNNEFSIDCHDMIFRNACYGNKFGVGCHHNTFGELCYNNTFGDGCYSNTFGDGCYNNTFGDKCYYNTFGYECKKNIFGNRCYRNTFGNECRYNTFGDNCYHNTFAYNCDNNTFDDNCDNNTFGDNCYNNTFGYECKKNTFGNGCDSNIYDKSCCEITTKEDCCRNKFGFACRRINLDYDCSSNTLGCFCYDITFVDATKYNTIGNNCKMIHLENTDGNTLSDYCANCTVIEGSNITFGRYCNNCESISGVAGGGLNISFGDSCKFCKMKYDNEGKNYYAQNIDIGKGSAYITLSSSDDDTTAKGDCIRNIKISNGFIGGNEDSPLLINVPVGSESLITVAKNSNGEVKIYCEADLIN